MIPLILLFSPEEIRQLNLSKSFCYKVWYLNSTRTMAPSILLNSTHIKEILNLYNMNLILYSKNHNTDYTNQLLTINCMQTWNNRKVNDRNKIDNHISPYAKRKKPHWSKNIKWKFLPGAVWSACGKTPHEIYKTGCPAMAIFCNCQQFFNKTKPEHLKLVIEKFAKFKTDQRLKQSQWRKEMSRTIKQLHDCGDKVKIKKVFADQYFNEFPEERLFHDDFEFSDDNNDAASSVSSKIREEVWFEQAKLKYELHKLTSKEWYEDVQYFINNQLNDVTPAVLFKVINHRATDKYHEYINRSTKVSYLF